MAKTDKTAMPQDIHVTWLDERMDQHGTPSINLESGHFESNFSTDENGRLILNSVSYIPPEKQKKLTDYYQSRADAAHKELQDLDQRFAVLLEQYVNDLKGAQCFDTYPPIEYERYIEEFLEILRHYRLRVSATVELM